MSVNDLYDAIPRSADLMKGIKNFNADLFQPYDVLAERGIFLSEQRWEPWVVTHFLLRGLQTSLPDVLYDVQQHYTARVSDKSIDNYNFVIDCTEFCTCTQRFNVVLTDKRFIAEAITHVDRARRRKSTAAAKAPPRPPIQLSPDRVWQKPFKKYSSASQMASDSQAPEASALGDRVHESPMDAVPTQADAPAVGVVAPQDGTEKVAEKAAEAAKGGHEEPTPKKRQKQTAKMNCSGHRARRSSGGEAAAAASQGEKDKDATPSKKARTKKSAGRSSPPEEPQGPPPPISDGSAYTEYSIAHQASLLHSQAKKCGRRSRFELEQLAAESRTAGRIGGTGARKEHGPEDADIPTRSSGGRKKKAAWQVALEKVHRSGRRDIHKLQANLDEALKRLHDAPPAAAPAAAVGALPALLPAGVVVVPPELLRSFAPAGEHGAKVDAIMKDLGPFASAEEQSRVRLLVSVLSSDWSVDQSSLKRYVLSVFGSL